MNKHSFERLEALAGQAMNDLMRNLIYEDEGVYVMYEQYYITQQPGYYGVYRYRDDTQRGFNRLRNAAAWCTLDYYGKLYESNRVIYLDQKLESLEIDKSIHARQKNKSDIDLRSIAMVKHQHDMYNQKIFRGELDKYIIMAKQCQQRGFENELTRTARKQKEQAG